MSSRHVLTVNWVYEILLQQHNVGDWKVALDTVIPARKGAQVRGEEEEDASRDSEAEEEGGAGAAPASGPPGEAGEAGAGSGGPA